MFEQKFARVPKDDVLFDENPTRFSLEHFRESLGNLKNPRCGCPQMLFPNALSSAAFRLSPARGVAMTSMLRIKNAADSS